MLFIAIIVIFILCVLGHTAKSSINITGGGSPPMSLHIIDLGEDKSVELLAYMAIEFAIDEAYMNRRMLEDKVERFFNCLKEGAQFKKNPIIAKAIAKAELLLESIPLHEKLSKPLLIRKLTGFMGSHVLIGDIKNMKAKIMPDTNVLNKINPIIKDKMVITSQLICDSHRRPSTSIPLVGTNGVYKIYLVRNFFLSYTCAKGHPPSYCFLDQSKVYDTSTTYSTKKELKDIKNINNKHKKRRALIELYMSKAIKDIGIVLSCLFNNLHFMTQDAWAMMIANRIFNVPVFYSKPTENEYYYYSKREVDGFTFT